MIRDEEQKAQELEQEIALMQREGHLGLRHGPPLQQRAQVEDPYFPHTPQHSKVSTTSMSEVPWRHTCK
jgi:hypothetical protein